LRLINPVQDGTPKKYAFGKQEITADGIYKFYEDWTSGKLKEIPLEQQPFELENEPYRILTSKNYHEVIADTDKDVLVFYHALTCEDCRPVQYMYDILAASLFPVKDLLVAKADVISNEIEGTDISRLPAIRFFPKGGDKAKPILYEGDLKEQPILEWVRKLSTVDWSKFDNTAKSAVKK